MKITDYLATRADRRLALHNLLAFLVLPLIVLAIAVILFHL